MFFLLNLVLGFFKVIDIFLLFIVICFLGGVLIVGLFRELLFCLFFIKILLFFFWNLKFCFNGFFFLYMVRFFFLLWVFFFDLDF